LGDIYHRLPYPFYGIEISTLAPFLLKVKYGAAWGGLAGHGGAHYVIWFFGYTRYFEEYDRWDS
jgi:hypothetical protein